MVDYDLGALSNYTDGCTRGCFRRLFNYDGSSGRSSCLAYYDASCEALLVQNARGRRRDWHSCRPHCILNSHVDFTTRVESGQRVISAVRVGIQPASKADQVTLLVNSETWVVVPKVVVVQPALRVVVLPGQS